MLYFPVDEAYQATQPAIGTRAVPTRLDWFLLALATALVVVAAVICIKPYTTPIEDAAMLMRYSQHLAAGQGIVWNVGEKPVDGATDFLFMAAVAAVSKLGLSLEASVRAIDLASHLVTAYLVFWAVRLPGRCSPWLAFLATSAFVLGPGLDYTAVYFGTPFFALFAALSWFFALLLATASDDGVRRLAPCLGLSCLTLALTRPEGVFLTAFILAGIVYYRSWNRSRAILLWTVAVFALLGGFYFLWRWNYFGYPLPNPYYKKGGGHLHFDALRSSIANVIKFAGFSIVIYLAGLFNKTTRKLTLFCVIPIVLFTGIWVTMSNEMNGLRRFQYAAYPLICMTWPIVLNGLLNLKPIRGALSSRPRQVLCAVLGVLTVAGFSLQLFVSFRRDTPADTRTDNNYAIGKVLSKYQDRGYSLATSEAGLLPFYSNWRSLDMWGLNDEWIAHHGAISEDYLARFSPDVIIFHANYAPAHPLSFTFEQGWWGLGRPWCTMIQIADRYALTRHYVLASIQPGDSRYAYYYFVKRDIKDSAAITKDIRDYFKAPPKY